MKEFDFYNVTRTGSGLVSTILGIAMITKLTSLGHQNTKEHLERLCNSAYAKPNLWECEIRVMQALDRFGKGNGTDDMIKLTHETEEVLSENSNMIARICSKVKGD